MVPIPVSLRQTGHESPQDTKPEGTKMTNATQLRNSKIDAVSALKMDYARFSKGLETEGVDKAAIQKILERISSQVAHLESEIACIA
jgi:hypothetical protein